MAFQRLAPVYCQPPGGINEDIYTTVSIPANCSTWTFAAFLYPPGSTVNVGGATAAFQSYSGGVSTIALNVVGQVLYAGLWTLDLWRTDTGFRTDNVNCQLEVTQIPSALGG